MNELERKRLAIYEDYIRQLRDIADDPGLTRDWKLVLMHGIFNELDKALANLGKEEG